MHGFARRNPIPPNTKLKKEQLMHCINQLNRKFIICGDVNAHHKRWEPQRTRNNTAGNTINNIIEENDNITLATPQNLRTHTDLNTGKTSTIDLCLCSANIAADIVIKEKGCLGSDHYPIQVKIAIEPERITRGKRRKWIIEENNWNAWRKNLLRRSC